MKIFLNKIKYLFWRNFSIIMLLLAIGIVVLFFSSLVVLPCGKEIETIITIIIGYLGLLYNLITCKIAKDKFFKELFIEFNSRFDNLNEAINEISTKKSHWGIIDDQKYKEAIVCDYLNLCAEEYLWYKKGRIEPDVWKAWSAGMKYYLSNPYIKEVYHKQKEERNSYYGLFEELEKLGIGN